MSLFVERDVGMRGSLMKLEGVGLEDVTKWRSDGSTWTWVGKP